MPVRWRPHIQVGSPDFSSGASHMLTECLTQVITMCLGWWVGTVPDTPLPQCFNDSFSFTPLVQRPPMAGQDQWIYSWRRDTQPSGAPGEQFRLHVYMSLTVYQWTQLTRNYSRDLWFYIGPTSWIFPFCFTSNSKPLYLILPIISVIAMVGATSTPGMEKFHQLSVNLILQLYMK